MKVNKSVESYVSKLVYDKAEEKRKELRKELSALVAMYEENDRKYSEALKKLIKKLIDDTKVKIEALMAKHNVSPRNTWRAPEVSIYAYDDAKTSRPEFIERKRKALEDEIHRINCIAREKTTEVIAKLILGGTAEDLEKMIADIKF